MIDKQDVANNAEITTERAAWEVPVLQRMDAGDAEAAGGAGGDVVFS